VYEEYYQQEYQKFLDFKPAVDPFVVHEKLQTEYPSPSAIDWDVTT